MTDSGTETIYSESEISKDESLHSSDEDFIDDSEYETSDSKSESDDDEYIRESKKQKIDKIEIKIKFKK